MEGFLHHIIVSDISLKLDALGYISVAESLSISSTTFTHCASKATEGHYAVQGHSSHRFRHQSKAHMRLPISD